MLRCFILSLYVLGNFVSGASDNNNPATRYILYDVNPGEGFNLRRDVYMRMAVFVRNLNIGDTDRSWVLVLPPWDHLYHWQSRELGPQRQIPWSQFFDVASLNHFVPVMEFENWLLVTDGTVDSVYYLQSYKEGWTNGKFEEKYDIRECLDPARYKLISDNHYEGNFFFYRNVSAKKFDCLSVQGRASVIKDFVKSLDENSIMLDRAENLLHDYFGNSEYWAARRSMRFNKILVSVADKFRLGELGSSDKDDNTVLDTDWWRHTVDRRQVRGGQYACVHMRRGDFAGSRGDQVASVIWVAKQLDMRLGQRHLDTLFVSTDASDTEMEILRDNLSQEIKIVRFRPTESELELYKDGGVAIIDQIICSHAKYFIGTRESTFTFRIQEEREIMGFMLEDTFDMLCKDGEMKCEGGTKWKIDWGYRADWSTPVKSFNTHDSTKYEL